MLLQVGKPFRQHQEQPLKMLLVSLLKYAVQRKNKGFRPMKEAHHAVNTLAFSNANVLFYLMV
jgi:hypothetical protein